MTRLFATPMAFKAALEARIADRARRSDRTINRIRQLFVMERFLVRVFETLDGVVLKGGLVMELRLDRARTTRDIDLRVTVDEAHLLEALRQAARLHPGDNLTFDVTRDEDHPVIRSEGLRYEGQRFSVAGMLAGRRYGEAFAVDIAIGEPLVGTPNTVRGDDLLDFIGVPAPVFRAYPVETHISEKLHAYTVPRPRPNSRVKDLPDLALLGMVGELDGQALLSAIHETYGHRKTHDVPLSFPAPPPTWEPVYARMATRDRLPWPSLDAVTAAVRAFLNPVLAGQIGRWDPAHWSWQNTSSPDQPLSKPVF
jgi:hypothetical protein